MVPLESGGAPPGPGIDKRQQEREEASRKACVGGHS